MNISTSFEIVAVTPAGQCDPSIAIAATRAGAIGVLDLEFIEDECTALRGVTEMAQHARGRTGIKLDSGVQRVFAAVSEALPRGLTVILVHADTARLPERVADLQHRKASVFVEVTGLDQALLGVEAGADGIVVKGHEAGGFVGEDTSLILLQRVIRRVRVPVWVHGGIGAHTAAACYVAGAAGVVLDHQLALTRESPLSPAARSTIACMDGSETTCLGGALGEPCRVYVRPGLAPLEDLQHIESKLAGVESSTRSDAGEWRRAVRQRVGWGNLDSDVWPVGQDAAFAKPFADLFGTVAGVIDGIRRTVEADVATAQATRPLDAGSALAVAHGTPYPIVQGPMTRVSDTPGFAADVAAAGGLPFLAISLMRAPDIIRLLERTRAELGPRPWGVGMLGFVPLELRQEQLQVIRTFRPPYALIAGGRADQALALEDAGIRTYLHVPSPGLLRFFVQNGARRFVFEGRECGGHVGPRSSFVLWDTAVNTLLECLPANDIGSCSVLFAGGIHDALSSSMVATIAAPLAQRGAGIGVLLGTAYLFTREALTSGAILQPYQLEAIGCSRTVLLETGPGHSTRCADTPFAKTFEREKRRLLAAGEAAEATRDVLERLNLGRLRIASKGLMRDRKRAQDPQGCGLVTCSADQQRSDGMYMIGQVATLREATCSIADLHRVVTIEGTSYLTDVRPPLLSRKEVDLEPRRQMPCDVAIIGMACVLPKAPELVAYWENILDKVDAITEIPADRWDWQRYFDPDPKARDKVYSKWGGFIDPVPFDPTSYGMPPSSIGSIEPAQLLTLEVVSNALKDAGYADRPFDRERTSVILGVGGGAGDLGQQYALRSNLPLIAGGLPPDVRVSLPEWTEDSFPGILINVTAGRVANRFDLGGVNYTVDAACASSLAAVYLAARELEDYTSDMVIVGGVDTVQNPFAYLCFAKTSALSPRGRCRPFDAGADGIAISEGVGVLVLKRLEDAERDGDRVYAVLKGVAGSSDGRDRGLTAPRPEGQALALQRAYRKADCSPATVSLIEAHGTGTVAGDHAEVETLKRVFEAAGSVRQGCAIGSVKSMIGHTKCAAGVAGLIKVALSLHHRVLPPTINVEQPNPRARFHESPFYLNTEARPWTAGVNSHLRRAGVSAFGFGGTNFHAVLEEHAGVHSWPSRPALRENWPCEVFVWAGDSRREMLERTRPVVRALARGVRPSLRDLAYTLWHTARDGPLRRLVIVAATADDLQQKLARVEAAFEDAGCASIQDPDGIYYTETPLAPLGKTAFLFPGQGAQYPGMLRELSLYFPEMRERFEIADHILAGRFPVPLSAYIFPPPRLEGSDKIAVEGLTATNVAQPALGVVDLGLCRLLQAVGIEPDIVAGHSYGEYVALCCAGVFSEQVLYNVSEVRGRSILECTTEDPGAMAAVPTDSRRVHDLLVGVDEAWIANVNAPQQTVISGSRAGISAAIERFAHSGISAERLQVACAFHSPIVARAADRLAAVLATIDVCPPRVPVFSNSKAAPYPDGELAIAELLTDHLVSPVRFAEEVEAMHDAGARVFVEVGPRRILTRLVDRILEGRPHIAIPVDGGKDSLLGFLRAIAQLAAQGVPVQLDRLFEGRAVRQLDRGSLEPDYSRKLGTTWLVSGGWAKPANGSSAMTVASLVTTRGSAGAPTDVPSNAEFSPSPLMAHGTADDRAPTPPVSGALPGAMTATAAMQENSGSLAGGALVGRDAAYVMIRYQQLMHRFVEAQQQVMEAYFRAGAQEASPRAIAQTGADTMRVAPLTTAAGPSRSVVAPIARRSFASNPPVHRSDEPRVPAASGSTAARTTSSEVTEVDRQSQLAVDPSSVLTNKSAMTRKLVEIVGERTGYPAELLKLNVDIESDLSIDSIKRVEILGALLSALPTAAQEKTRAAMETLTTLKTLQAIVDAVWSCVGTRQPDDRVNPVESVGAAHSMPERSAKMQSDDLPPVPRFVTAPAEAPLRPEALNVTSSEVTEVDRQSRLAVDPSSVLTNKSAMTRKLVEIVGERTGYPAELLKLNVDIESDLSIDSIKRVEILGALQGALPTAAQEKTRAAMETLTTLKTLEAIVDAVWSCVGTRQPDDHVNPPESVGAAHSVPERSPKMQSEELPPVPRFVMATAEAPLWPAALDMVKGRTLLITDDEGGVASAAVAALRGHGARVVLARLRPDTCLEGDVFETDLTDFTKVTELVARVNQMHGAIDGVLHLLPLRSAPRFEDMDLNSWRGCLRADVMSLFHLAKSAATAMADLPTSRIVPKSLIAATSLGAAFGGAYNQSLSPTHGGVAGLMKALATEQTAWRIKVVDLNRTHDPQEMAAHLLAELTVADDLVEVAYDGLRRIVLCPIPAASRSEPIVRVASDSVILITGGARGITAEIAKELAERYQPTLVLLGRSPLPSPSEAGDTAGVRSPHQLKRALIQRLQWTGEEVSVVRLEALHRNLLKEREIRATIDAIQTAGARCHYLEVDVRDDQAFGDAIDLIYRTHGRLDGVIHAAGVLDDRLARDKTAESFLRVLETKVLGAFTLAQRLRPETLEFLCFFSSIAGRFGNAGQTDYAAANEILNKIAVRLDGQWPGRVFAVNWGPWNSVGMVSPEIERKFLDSGLELIPPAAGRLAFDEELRFGRKGETEVILGAIAGTRHQSRQMKHARSDCPLLNGGRLARRADTEIEFVRTLDPERDAYLQDHRLDGQFVFPMAMAMELAAEVVQRGWPESEFQGIRSLSVLAGIAFERETTVRVIARPHTRRLSESVAGSMDVEIAELHRPERPSYRAIVQMGDRPPSSPSAMDGVLSDLEPFPLTVDESYRRWLFHGRRFQGILAVEGLNERGIRGLLRPSAPAQCLETSAGGTWLIDPVLLDCGLQLAILWHRAQHDMTPLPSRFASYSRFGRADENDVRCSLHAASARGGYTLSTTIWFSDAASGRVLSVLEGVEFSCTQSLNRLAHLATSHSR